MKNHAKTLVALALALGSSACQLCRRPSDTPAAPACEYEVVQLTSNSDPDVRPCIDASNRVVWSGWDGDSELFRYDPATGITTQLTHNSRSDSDPRINAGGEIVWMAYDGNDTEIFHHDGAAVVQITNNSIIDRDPRISDAGAIVWTAVTGSSSGTSTNDVFLHQAGTTTQITNTPGDSENHATINAGGDIAWTGTPLPSGDSELFFRSGSTGVTTQLTNNSTSDHAPFLNEHGDIAWFGGDGSGVEAYYRDAATGVTAQVTSVDFLSPGPIDINANGYAVYGGLAQGESQPQVWLYDGSTVTQITSGSRAAKDPRLNDDDHVIYWINAPLAPAGPDDELYCYDPASGNTTRITDDAVSNDVRPATGKGGYIAWEGNDATGNDSEIFIGIPAAPDLVIESLTHAPASPTTVQTIAFTAVVRNVGGAMAGASRATLRVGGESPGQVFDVPVLAAGASHVLQRQVTLNVAQNYVNTATADSAGDVIELDESNNQRTDHYTVASGGVAP